MRLGQIGGLGSDTKISGRHDKYCFWMFIWIFQDIRYALKQKKRYYLGIFPKRRTPPHPPLLGTPYPKKNFSVYFAFQNLRSIFVLQKKIIFQEHFQNNVGKFTQSFGNRGPPPFWEKFPNNPVFFLQQDNSDNFASNTSSSACCSTTFSHA